MTYPSKSRRFEDEYSNDLATPFEREKTLTFESGSYIFDEYQFDIFDGVFG